VICGGLETWEWDGATWMLRSSEGPLPRSGHALAYDSDRDVTILFGGVSLGNYGAQLFDTWEWDGSSWTQRAALGPPSGGSMAYDAARDVTVFVPGRGTDGETWEWDGATWIQRGGSGPSRDYDFAIAYDSARNVTVLFGGTEIGDTWEWDGMQWTLRAHQPGSRWQHALAYDSARQRTVLFGGSSYRSGGDTWERDAHEWSLRSETGPLPRYQHAMAYDGVRGVTVLFGGFRIGAPFPDYTSVRCCRSSGMQCLIHRTVSFSCSEFCFRRSESARKSTWSSGWSWLKHEKT